MSGKSTFLNRLLLDWSSMYPNERIRKIVLVHKFSDQPTYRELRAHFGDDKLLLSKDFSEELLSVENIGHSSEGVCIFILDDVLHDVASNPLLTDLVIGSTHHLR